MESKIHGDAHYEILFLWVEQNIWMNDVQRCEAGQLSA
jgi:hypothetical protein